MKKTILFLIFCFSFLFSTNLTIIQEGIYYEGGSLCYETVTLTQSVGDGVPAWSVHSDFAQTLTNGLLRQYHFLYDDSNGQAHHSFDDYTFTAYTGPCVIAPTCPIGQVYVSSSSQCEVINSQGTCPTGNVRLSDGSCSTCGSSEIYDSNASKCVSKCQGANNYLLSNGSCSNVGMTSFELDAQANCEAINSSYTPQPSVSYIGTLPDYPGVTLEQTNIKCDNGVSVLITEYQSSSIPPDSNTTSIADTNTTNDFNSTSTATKPFNDFNSTADVVNSIYLTNQQLLKLNKSNTNSEAILQDIKNTLNTKNFQTDMTSTNTAVNSVTTAVNNQNSNLGSKLDNLIQVSQNIADKNTSVNLSGVETKLDNLHNDLNSTNDKISKLLNGVADNNSSNDSSSIMNFINTTYNNFKSKYDNVQSQIDNAVAFIKGKGLPTVLTSHSVTTCPKTFNFSISSTISKNITIDPCIVFSGSREYMYTFSYIGFSIGFISLLSGLLIRV